MEGMNPHGTRPDPIDKKEHRHVKPDEISSKVSFSIA